MRGLAAWLGEGRAPSSLRSWLSDDRNEKEEPDARVRGPDGAFAQSRECFAELEEWLASEEAAGLQHAELEEQLEVRGRELLRRLFQDRLDVRAAARAAAGAR